jgi:hypothetical protein
VAGGRDEVEATVDASGRDAPLPVDVDLLLKVLLVLGVDELHHGLPAVLIVDVVPKPRCDDHSQLHPHPFSSISWVMDLISRVLGMRSSDVGCTDFRLIFGLEEAVD